jgi:hypothetical protein
MPKEAGTLIKQDEARLDGIEVVQSQLYLLESLVKGLDEQYKKFFQDTATESGRAQELPFGDPFFRLF